MLSRLMLRRRGVAEVPGGLAGAEGMMAQAEGLQKEIAEIVARHGFDPSRPSVGGGTPEDAAAMQREIMAAMQRHGLPVPGAAVLPQQPQAPVAPSEGDGPIRDPLSGR